MKRVQKGHVTLKWCVHHPYLAEPNFHRHHWCRHRRRLPTATMYALVALLTFLSWDLGGQPRFRSMWERYCRNVNAIVFIVDSADKGALDIAKEELHSLLEKPAMEGIPLLVLGNKSDLSDHLTVDELIERLDLKVVSRREVSCYGISAKEETNLDAVLQWLIAKAQK